VSFIQVVYHLLESEEWNHKKKSSLEVKKPGKKIDINSDLEEERLPRAHAEEKPLGKSSVPRLVGEYFIALRILFQVEANSPVHLWLIPFLTEATLECSSESHNALQQCGGQWGLWNPSSHSNSFCCPA